MAAHPKINDDAVSGRDENTTAYVIKEIAKAIESRCAKLPGNEKLIFIGEKILSENVSGQRRSFMPKSAEKCQYEERCAGKYILTYKGDTFREVDYTLTRSNGVQSYEINVETSWSYDLPVPFIDVAIKSESCR